MGRVVVPLNAISSVIRRRSRSPRIRYSTNIETPCAPTNARTPAGAGATTTARPWRGTIPDEAVLSRARAAGSDRSVRRRLSARSRRRRTSGRRRPRAPCVGGSRGSRRARARSAAPAPARSVPSRRIRRPAPRPGRCRARGAISIKRTGISGRYATARSVSKRRDERHQVEALVRPVQMRQIEDDHVDRRTQQCPQLRDPVVVRPVAASGEERRTIQPEEVPALRGRRSFHPAGDRDRRGR